MDKERIYDDQIAPLMEQIIAICKSSGIAMVSSFSIPTEADDGLQCTTYMPDECGDLPERYAAAARALGLLQTQPLSLRTVHGDGNMTATIIA